MGGRVPDDDLPTAAPSKIVPEDDLPSAPAAKTPAAAPDNDVYGIGAFLKNAIGTALKQHLGPALAGTEMALQAGTGFASKIAGGLAGAGAAPFIGGDRATQLIHNVEEAGTYQPRSDAAHEASAELGSVVAPVLGFAGRQTAKLGNAGETIVNAGAEAAADILPMAKSLKMAGAAGRAAETARAAAAPAAPIGETTTQAIDRGWNLRPSDVEKANPAAKGTVPGTTRQTLQNQGKLHSDAVLENQAKATREAGEEIGVENATELTPKHFEELRAPHNKNYETAGKAAGKFADEELQGKLDSIVKNTPAEDKQRIAAHQITQDFDPTNMSGPELVESIQKLRIDASRGANSSVVREQNLGAVRKKVANALEDALSKRLDTMGDKQIVTAFQSSRQALAKLHNVEDSLTGGQIDPQKLLAARNAGAPLTGKLAEIADMAEKFPEVVRSAHGTSTGGGLPHTKTGVIGSTVGAIVRKIPGLDVSTPAFRQKIAAAGKTQQAKAGDAFNRAKPIKPIESNQGRQPDMVGPDGSLTPPGEHLGDLLDNGPDTRPVTEATGPAPGIADANQFPLEFREFVDELTAETPTYTPRPTFSEPPQDLPLADLILQDAPPIGPPPIPRMLRNDAPEWLMNALPPEARPPAGLLPGPGGLEPRYAGPTIAVPPEGQLPVSPGTVEGNMLLGDNLTAGMQAPVPGPAGLLPAPGGLTPRYAGPTIAVPPEGQLPVATGTVEGNVLIGDQLSQGMRVATPPVAGPAGLLAAPDSIKLGDILSELLDRARGARIEGNTVVGDPLTPLAPGAPVGVTRKAPPKKGVKTRAQMSQAERAKLDALILKLAARKSK